MQTMTFPIAYEKGSLRPKQLELIPMEFVETITIPQPPFYIAASYAVENKGACYQYSSCNCTEYSIQDFDIEKPYSSKEEAEEYLQDLKDQLITMGLTPFADLLSVYNRFNKHEIIFTKDFFYSDLKKFIKSLDLTSNKSFMTWLKKEHKQFFQDNFEEKQIKTLAWKQEA